MQKKTRSKYTLEQLLAPCDPSTPLSNQERVWLDAAPVGREWGSNEWQAAEAAGKLTEFLDGTWEPVSRKRI